MRRGFSQTNATNSPTERNLMKEYWDKAIDAMSHKKSPLAAWCNTAPCCFRKRDTITSKITHAHSTGASWRLQAYLVLPTCATRSTPFAAASQWRPCPHSTAAVPSGRAATMGSILNQYREAARSGAKPAPGQVPSPSGQ